jgi:hypothetical protein
MPQTLNISDIFQRYDRAFGYAAMKVTPRLIQAGFNPKWYLNIPVYDKTESVYAEMEFENTKSGDKYSFGIDALEDGTPALPFMKQEVNESRFLAPPPMVSFRRSKHKVITPIDRSEYEVIENFGNKGYRISLNGILIDQEKHQYPSALVKAAHNMFGAPGTYKVNGQIFEDLEIYELFFEDDFRVEFVEGFVDTVKFSVMAMAVQSAVFRLT